MTTHDTTPEADLIKRAQAALDGYDQQDIADYAHLTFASGVVALATENAALRADNDRLRATLEFYADRADTGYQVEIIDYGAEYILGKIIRLGGKPARAALDASK